MLTQGKQVQTKLPEGQRITQRLFHSWPKPQWLMLVGCTFPVSARGVCCSSLLLRSRKGGVSDALELSVQISLGIAELLGDSELLLTLPKTTDFPIPTDTLFPTARKNLTTLQKYERGFFNPTGC
uniref:Uncharacterized protein n=1 Tax=Zonotrichia albicollis TaxID=44394 RepID=A0A8D2MW32_ZONAL